MSNKLFKAYYDDKNKVKVRYVKRSNNFEINYKGAVAGHLAQVWLFLPKIEKGVYTGKLTATVPMLHFKELKVNKYDFDDIKLDEDCIFLLLENGAVYQCDNGKPYGETLRKV